VPAGQILSIYRRFKKTERTKVNVQYTYGFSDPWSIIALVEIRQSINKNITSDWSRSCHPLRYKHTLRALLLLWLDGMSNEHQRPVCTGGCT